MALTQLLDLSLVLRADRAALECATPDGVVKSYTFGDLERRSNAVAHVLVARGLSAGDRLALLLPNRVEVIDLWLACLKLGVIVVPINVLYREREVGHIVSDAKPRAVVTTAGTRVDVPRHRDGVGTSMNSFATQRPPPTCVRRAWRTPTRLPRSSTRRAPPARRRAPSSRTACSPRTPSRWSARGRSPTPIATWPCCRSSTCTVSATA